MKLERDDVMILLRIFMFLAAYFYIMLSFFALTLWNRLKHTVVSIDREFNCIVFHFSAERCGIVSSLVKPHCLVHKDLKIVPLTCFRSPRLAK